MSKRKPSFSSEDTTLARTLGHGPMAMIAMGSALGTGLFLGSGEAIGIAGPAVIVSFAIGSLIAATVALSMGEMASRHPVSGGFGTLASHYLSPYCGYLVRWMYWIVTISVTAAELLACAHYLSYWIPEIPIWLGIIIFAVIIVAINVSSVGSFGTIEFFLSSIKVIGVLVFIAVGLYLVFIGSPGEPAPGLSRLFIDGFAPNGWAAVWVALSITMFSFGGIELLSITAAEAEDPARSIRTAAQTTAIRLAFFYVLSITIVVALVPWQEAATTGSDVATSPFVTVFESIGVGNAAHITNLLVLVAAFSAANANMYASSRMIHSLAHDGFAPRMFSRVTKRRVPIAGITASSVGIIIIVTLAYSGVGGLFVYLMTFITFAIITVWFFILVTYIVFRRRKVEGATFHMPGGIASAVVGLIGITSVLATAVVREQMMIATVIGLSAIALATVLYFLFVRKHVDPAAIEQAFDEADALR